MSIYNLNPIEKFIQSEEIGVSENEISQNREIVPSWPVAGPLHYGMSLEEMDETIQKKFQELATQGRLIREGTLNNNRSSFHPPMDKQADNNLTRIWGAEFLKRGLQEDSALKVADHFLVIEEEATEIEVQVWRGEYPCLSIVRNAYIVSQKIIGQQKSKMFSHSTSLDRLQYRDFSDPGNILQDCNGIGWIVDTEAKSFDLPCLDEQASRVLSYAKNRFEALYGRKLYRTFKIPVSKLFSEQTPSYTL